MGRIEAGSRVVIRGKELPRVAEGEAGTVIGWMTDGRVAVQLDVLGGEMVVLAEESALHCLDEINEIMARGTADGAAER